MDGGEVLGGLVVDMGEDQPKQKVMEMVNDVRSVLDMIPVPRGFVRSSYSSLVMALLHHGILALGLYRPAGVSEASLPFALANPDPATVLVAADQVYILRPHSTPGAHHHPFKQHHLHPPPHLLPCS